MSGSSTGPTTSGSSSVASSSATQEAATAAASVEIRRSRRCRRLSQLQQQIPNSSVNATAAESSTIEECPCPALKRFRCSQPSEQQQQSDRRPGTPSDRCAICLCEPVDASYTWSCLHRYCFDCLLEWAKRKPECPQCKRPFTTIIHNVRADNDYEEYPVPQAPALAPPPVWALGGASNTGGHSTSNVLFTSRAGPLYLYRTNQTVAAAAARDSDEEHRQLRSAGQHQQQQQQQSSNLTRPNFFSGLQVTDSPVWQSHQQHQYMSIFDYYHQRQPNQDATDANTSGGSSSGSIGLGGRSLQNLLPYEDAEDSDPSQPLPSPLTGANRHLLYLRNLHPVPDPQAALITAARFSENETERHRLVPFLLRELRCLTRYDGNAIQRVVHHLLRLVANHDLDSALFRSLAKAYVGRHGKLFCINLAHFAAAVDLQPTLAQYDSAVQYQTVDTTASNVNQILNENDSILRTELDKVKRNLRPGPTPLDFDDALSPMERDFSSLTPRQRPMILSRLAQGDSDSSASGNGSSGTVINYMQLLHSVAWRFSNDLYGTADESQAGQATEAQQQQRQPRRPSSPWPESGGGAETSRRTTAGAAEDNRQGGGSGGDSSEDYSLLGAALLAPFEAAVAAAAAAAAVAVSASAAATPPLSTAAASSTRSASSSASSSSPILNRRSGILATPKRNSGYYGNPMAATPLLSHLLNATPSSSSADVGEGGGVGQRIASLASADYRRPNPSSPSTANPTAAPTDNLLSHQLDDSALSPTWQRLFNDEEAGRVTWTEMGILGRRRLYRRRLTLVQQAAAQAQASHVSVAASDVANNPIQPPPQPMPSSLSGLFDAPDATAAAAAAATNDSGVGGFGDV